MKGLHAGASEWVVVMNDWGKGVDVDGDMDMDVDMISTRS